MSREKETFRANLERVTKAFPESPETVPLTAVSAWIGIDYRTLLKSGLRAIKAGRKNVVPKAEIARWLST